MSALIKHNGVWKEPELIHVKHNGVWKEVSGKSYLPGTPMEGGFFGGFSSLSGNTYALILADKSAEQSLKWKDRSTTSSGASSSNDGWANTNAINNSDHPAAQYCRQYDGGGFTDWYLGAPLEYRSICDNLRSGKAFIEIFAPEFASDGSQFLPQYLWTSRAGASSYAYRITTDNGVLSSSTNKTLSYPVRPIRRVLINL